MGILLRSQFPDQYLSTQLPAIEGLIQEAYEMRPDMVPQLFNIVNSTKGGIHQSTSMGSFGLLPSVAEGEDISMLALDQGFDKTYQPVAYQAGFQVSLELVQDGRFDLPRGAAKALGRSVMATKQTEASKVFNEAFSATNFTGGDGKELCATDHVLVNGAAARNELSTAADLSVSSLKQALIDFDDEMVDEAGKFLAIAPKVLLVPSELQFDASELLKSSGLPDTANNNSNSLQDKGLQSLVWHSYLTDADAWFLLADKSDHDINYVENEAMNVKSYEVDSNYSMVTAVRLRFKVGHNDWHGVFGSSGA